MSATRILFFLAILVCIDRAAAQTTGDDGLVTGDAPVAIKHVNCTLHNSSMISPTLCTYYDKQNMASETGNCQSFLTNWEDAPNPGCCEGFRKIAGFRIACICDATFYPPVTVNFTRQLALPFLCSIVNDLCVECPTYLVSRTEEYPVGGVEKRSVAARVAAIVLGVILSVVLLVGAVALTITELKKQKEEKTAEVFEAAPPGGAF
ncbi:uncharacterized protein [Physcomitrium patens]|uniref:Bifunctional inhibitor/plant lipid transfer protein/seed storage helical domain-containing protein n=1 Tax=Physcomitrium patens TaxID=3218 RepID=A9TCS6_PHYPA|nr:uncharacterized protein LOC112289288 [Physcomitrium patens]PNR43284.1 hypothetical protein PHYPA_015664 [Physcomitrium patens]|eukprot:XP_024390155.1 uncharacterized protein LOC112289288 [Physcomitrella patens]